MQEAAEFTLSATAVWFVVYAVRSWFPARVRAFLDGPQRVWPVVYLVSFGLLTLLDGALSRETVFEALTVAIGAVGVDAVRQVRQPAPIDPEPNVMNEPIPTEGV